tara:strand:+ start:18398 stop:19060 length:663 start_codon:yes stop_codon:yes gene_type:complete
MLNNFFDFIEIGTSDFDTLIEKSDDDKRGISIEPIQYFLDRLPDRKNCIKICAAISDEEGEADLYYIPEENIEKYNLPGFVRGTGSLYNRHPFILTLLANEAEDNQLPEALDPDDIIVKTKVRVTRLKNIVDQHNVKAIKILKIDAEGTDGKILLDYFDCCKNEGYPYPFFIQYENVLLPESTRRKLLLTAIEAGYSVALETYHDTMLVRKFTAQKENEV